MTRVAVSIPAEAPEAPAIEKTVARIEALRAEVQAAQSPLERRLAQVRLKNALRRLTWQKRACTQVQVSITPGDAPTS